MIIIKQVNLTDKYVKGRIWWFYFLYDQGHLIAWRKREREREVEHFIGLGLVVFVKVGLTACFTWGSWYYAEAASLS